MMDHGPSGGRLCALAKRKGIAKRFGVGEGEKAMCTRLHGEDTAIISITRHMGISTPKRLTFPCNL